MAILLGGVEIVSSGAEGARRALPLRGAEPEARALLRRAREPGDLEALRALLARETGEPVARLDDPEVVRRLTWLLAQGRLHAIRRTHLRAPVSHEEVDAPDPAWPVPPPAPLDEPAAPPSERWPTVDAAAQVAALKEAAKSGAPFCEECAKAKAAAREAPTFSPRVDAAAQAAALRDAASSGAPFCEECAKAKAAQAAGGPAT